MVKFDILAENVLLSLLHSETVAKIGEIESSVVEDVVIRGVLLNCVEKG
jgi:hypothetical protein